MSEQDTSSKETHWIDAHAHLSVPEMTLPAVPLLQEAAARGCVGVVNVATDPTSFQLAQALQKEIPWAVVAAAVTPHEAGPASEAWLEQVIQAAHVGQLVAVGETGLDYFHWKETQPEQRSYLKRQLELAAELELPVVIHCRGEGAFEDLFSMLDLHYARGGRWLPGMLHCFTGTAEEAERLVAQGWYVSISGIVTYPKSQSLRDIAAAIPLERLLLETDAPWLAPQSCRGKINRPDHLLETAQVVAVSRQTSRSDLMAAVTQNARRLFPQAPFGGTSSAV